PNNWEKRLVDMNITRLKDKDLKWADLVFISAMSIQKPSAEEVVARCKEVNVKTVAGGPLFTTEYDDFLDKVDHLVLNEAEVTLPPFLKDLKEGHAKPMYTSDEYVNLAKTPLPLWELVNIRKYASMNLQYSRGCPFDCEFCDISVLYGRKVRTKGVDQILAELSALYSRGWRGDVFLVDDNFIGNSRKLKAEILPAIIEWAERRKRPFSFQTEVSINLADDIELMHQMTRAGFNSVFVGIETTNEDSLIECNKLQNKNRDLLACVSRIHEAGLRVVAGFILGFDSDPPSIFERMNTFIQESGIVSAMIGLLNAPKDTKLYWRLKEEGRLLDGGTGDSMGFSMNFVPKMDYTTLIEGYRTVIRKVYSSSAYYQRVRRYLKEHKPPRGNTTYFRLSQLPAFPKSVIFLGILGKERLHYWRLFFWTLFTRPRLIPLALTLAIYGFHFRKFFENQV
ncbi:B12-binding domain-containing radical SAM protein, partial [bacterium]|nr:B12-binding domain-containing radical SAM protein [bacterium]